MKTELRHEQCMDEYREEQRTERWDKFKSGLDLHDELNAYLEGFEKEELIIILLIIDNNDDTYYPLLEELDTYLQDVYDGEW